MDGEYSNVNIPDGKKPENYSYAERRAELLQVIIEAGHPDLVSRTKFAQRYDVDPSTITKDINDHLVPGIQDELAKDAEMVTNVVFRKAIKEKASNQEWMEATELLDSWNDWLFATGAQEKAPDKLEVESDAGDAYIQALKEDVEESEDE